MSDCTHIPAEPPTVTPQADVCQDCIEIGSDWVHLRVCVDCGRVSCCDASRHHHAHSHYRANQEHRLIRSYEPGEAWWYCFEDDHGFELEGVGPLRS
ncbi:MAG: UBP-type zinc finger domain-containing protein [Acidimicrobiia bacterium]